MAIANWSNSQVVAQLDSGTKWSGSTITYAFPTTAAGMYSQGEATAFRAVSAAQQVYFLLALQTWDDLIPQNFEQTTSISSDIEMAYTTSNIDYAHAYYPTIGSAWFNPSYSDVTSPTIGGYGFCTLIHELGHALGLNHMGDYNGSGSWTPSSYQDTVVLSIMSYFGPAGTGNYTSSDIMPADWVAADGTGYSAQTPMVNDVMTIQYIYGTSTTTRTGDTAYGFSSNITGSLANLYDFSINKNPILTIFDSGGNDTLNFSGWSTPSYISLEPGTYSSCNSMTNNIGIAYSATIENAIGGSGNDVLLGNSSANRLDGGAGNDQFDGKAGDDILTGGAGNDTINGGDGNDTAIFASAFANYTISYNAGSATFTLTNATTGTDTVTNVENFQFSDVTKTAASLTGSTPVSDTIAPTLSSMTPADNAIGVAASANLVLTFSETVQAGLGNIVIYNVDGTVAKTIAANDTSQVTISGSTVTINPTTDLNSGNSYYVNIAAGAIKDLSGNSYAGLTGTTAYSFSTVASAIADDYPWSTSTTGVVTVNGSAKGGVIETVNDADLFKVSLTAGSTYVFELDRTSGGLADPYLRLYDPSVNLAAFDDDGGANGNAKIVYTATTTGTYYLGAFDYDSGTGGYTIKASTAVDDYPWSTSTTGVVTVDGTVSHGTIEIAYDADLFKVTLTAGQTYDFDLVRTSGGLTDPYLYLYDSSVNLVAFDDNSGSSGNAHITFTATTSGTYYLGASDYDSGIGGYTLSAATNTSPGTTTGLIIDGTNGDDILHGQNGNDILIGYAGNDILDGGGGTDTAYYGGNINEYDIVLYNDGMTVDDLVGNEGFDQLYNMERMEFADQGLAFDVDGPTSAGGIYRLYQATFDRTPDWEGLGYWIAQADRGEGAIAMAIDFTYSTEFQQMYGVTTRDNYLTGANIENVVSGFYQHVLHRAADQAGLNYYVNVIVTHEKTVGQVLAEISDSPENYVQTIGQMQNGIDYVPWYH
ncbi:MAG: hypothetical protein H6R04_100 [Burkholderiaceae bacterium]|nr:hypothetical protein [Burkholderiaceae bacterium]